MRLWARCALQRHRTNSVLTATAGSGLRDQERREEEFAQHHPILVVGWVWTPWPGVLTLDDHHWWTSGTVHRWDTDLSQHPQASMKHAVRHPGPAGVLARTAAEPVPGVP